MREFIGRWSTWIADDRTQAVIAAGLAAVLADAVLAADRRAMRAHQRITSLERSLGLRAVPCG